MSDTPDVPTTEPEVEPTPVVPAEPDPPDEVDNDDGA